MGLRKDVQLEYHNSNSVDFGIFLSFVSQYDLQGIIGLLYKLLGGAPFIRTKNHVSLQHTLNNPLYTNISILWNTHTISMIKVQVTTCICKENYIYI